MVYADIFVSGVKKTTGATCFQTIQRSFTKQISARTVNISRKEMKKNLKRCLKEQKLDLINFLEVVA